MIDSNDPRLTAYALGELEATEAAAVGTALADDKAARTEVEDIREAAALLRRALASETAPLLTDAQRQSIRSSAAKGPREVGFSPLRLLAWAGAAAAACLAIGLLVTPALRQGKGTTPVALRRAPSPVAEEAVQAAAAPATDSAAADAAQGPGAVAAPLVTATRAPRLKAMRATEETDRTGPTDTDTPAAGGMLAAAAAAAAPPGPSPGQPGLGQGPGLLGAPLGLGGGPAAIAGLPRPAMAPVYRATEGALEAAHDSRPDQTTLDLPEAFIRTAAATVSTLPLTTGDPDSYEAVRRHLSQGRLPPPAAVCIAGLLDHFVSSRDTRSGSSAPRVWTEVAVCPWQPAHRLVRIAVAAGQPAAAVAQAARAAAGRPAEALAVRTAAAEATADAGALRLDIELSPERIAAYRYLGPEDAGVDRGDAAARALPPDQTLTAFYQVIPIAREMAPVAKAQAPALTAAARAIPAVTDALAATAPLVTVRLHWRRPGQTDPQTTEVSVQDQPLPWAQTSQEMQFAGAVALFGMLLNQSPQVGEATFDTVLELAGDEGAPATDTQRLEFIALVQRARAISAVAAEQPKP